MAQIVIDATPLRSLADRMSESEPVEILRRPYFARRPANPDAYQDAMARAVESVFSDDADDDDLATQVAKYYQQLISAGMPGDVAARLTATYQTSLMDRT